MSVVAAIFAELIVRNVPRVYIGPGPALEHYINKADGEYLVIEDEAHKKTVIATINSNSGEVIWTPSSKVVESGDSGHWHLGYSEAEVTNSGTFEVSGSFAHTFSSAYSGTVSTAVRAEFWMIFEAELSASVTIDINNLGKIECVPDSLHWTIVKVKKVTDSSGNVSEEEFSL